jgi:hypothetical protein
MMDARPKAQVVEDMARHFVEYPPLGSVDEILRRFLDEMRGRLRVTPVKLWAESRAYCRHLKSDPFLPQRHKTRNVGMADAFLGFGCARLRRVCDFSNSCGWSLRKG